MTATIKIIGTSHISKDSVRQIKDAISKEKPDIVAVELDKGRMQALLSKTSRKPRLSDIGAIGIQGYLFAIVGGWLQKKLGNIVGTDPGSDMLAAIKAAQESGAQVALIDRDIGITLKRFSRHFGWREKWNMLVDAAKGIFGGKKALPFDIRKMPTDKVVEELIGQVRERYPGIYKVLIEERNIYMANQLARIAAHKPDANIIAVVGAGHKKEMLGELQKIFKRHKQDDG